MTLATLLAAYESEIVEYSVFVGQRLPQHAAAGWNKPNALQIHTYVIPEKTKLKYGGAFAHGAALD